MNTIIDYMEYWAGLQPGKLFGSFLDINGKENETYTYSSFNERSRRLAEYLSLEIGVSYGDRVLLVYDSGFEILMALLACARIGAVPVPVHPLTPMNFTASLTQLKYILHNCDARYALTTHKMYQFYLSKTQQAVSAQTRQEWLNLDWIPTDDIDGNATAEFQNNPNSVLFLQYTSGSTSNPKGVVVSHENVIHNCQAVVGHNSDIVGVCWLPQFHDLGLIGYYINLIITGGTTYGFSPMNFLKKPALWLQTLSRFRGTHTAAPNFGYEYCLRENAITPEELTDIDLSSVSVMQCGAEPVKPSTFRRFLERFEPYGLRRESLVTAYGLAENTLVATCFGRRILTVNKQKLQEGEVQIEQSRALNTDQFDLISNGYPLDGVQVKIVDPESRASLSANKIGEIWLSGKSICQGYWNSYELTHDAFHNTIEDDTDTDVGHSYLRTGDLGFIETGELFVCGRLKDIIIIRGVNYYPQDIERIVESTSLNIKSGKVVAFNGLAQNERLFIAIGVKKSKDLPDPEIISKALNNNFYNISHTIVYIPERNIIRTTSGKIARSRIRQDWLDGKIQIIKSYTFGERIDEINKQLLGVHSRLKHILESYNVIGNEDKSLVEIGIDSLDTALILLEIEKILDENDLGDLKDAVDGRILQQLTVAELLTLIHHLELGSDPNYLALKGILEQISRENARLEQIRMQQDMAVRENNVISLTYNMPNAVSNVLLTGATGFFGPFLLKSLLCQTTYNYYILIRAKDSDSGISRIRDTLLAARLMTPSLEQDLEHRVHIICGDLAKPNFGISSPLWTELTSKIHAIIHNAATVNYAMNYSALRETNVLGTQELLRFACEKVQKEFHLISSTIIFGWTSKAELLEIDNNENMSNLDFGYAQTKWVSEQLVHVAHAQGLPTRVYRPSFISASVTGVASKNDIIIRLLAFMITHGIAPYSQNQISFLPADVAANNIASIFEMRDTKYRTFHITVDNYYNLEDILHIITCEYGYEFKYYDLASFVKEMNRLCTISDPVYPLLDVINRTHLKLITMEEKRYNNNQYRETLQLTSNAIDDPSLSDTVSYIMTYMLHEGIIPSPQVVNDQSE